MSYLLTTAEDLPDPLPPGVWAVPLGIGDRREVLVRGPGGLAELPEGSAVAVTSLRHRALLRALHPGLVAVEGGTPDTPAILPLWPDPSLAVRGDVLEWESWLPEPGQGIPVLVHTGSGEGIVAAPGAAAVLLAERRVARAFPGRVVCVRAQLFEGGMRVGALVLSADGRQGVRGAAQGAGNDPGQVADALVELLRRRGAERVTVPPS